MSGDHNMHQKPYSYLDFECPRCGHCCQGYELGFVDGMQHQMKSSVDKALNENRDPVIGTKTWFEGGKEDIIKLARKAGLAYGSDERPLGSVTRFATLAVAAEREACAELVMQGTNEPVQTKTLAILRKERERIAKAIRARSEQ